MQRRAQERVQRAVQLGVTRAIVGAIEIALGAQRMRVGSDVLVLQVHRQVRQHGNGAGHVELLAGVALLELLHEVAGVVLGEARALGRQVGDADYRILVGRRHFAHGIDHVGRSGQHLHLVRERFEVVGDLAGLGGPLGDQRFACLRFECGPAGVQRFTTHDHRGDCHRDDGEEQGAEQQLLPDGLGADYVTEGHGVSSRVDRGVARNRIRTRHRRPRDR